MGKTPANKRLVIVAYPPVSEWPELKELADKGHEVRYELGEYSNADLILGPNCWRMDEPLRKYLDLAVKNARSRKVTK